MPAEELDCPECGGKSLLVFVRETEWMVCKKCEIRWLFGGGNFTGGTGMTDKEVEEAEAFLAQFREHVFEEPDPSWTQRVLGMGWGQRPSPFE